MEGEGLIKEAEQKDHIEMSQSPNQRGCSKRVDFPSTSLETIYAETPSVEGSSPHQATWDTETGS